MRRKTGVQTERDEQGLIDSFPVRESPFVIDRMVSGHKKTSQKNHSTSRLKGGCGQDWPPHTL